MSRTPRLTVIIPAHDASTTVGPAIASVLDQGRDDVEVIVVDDASRDDTAAVAQAVADDAATSVTVIRQDRNQGVSAARNTALRAARGEIIVFLDADDVQLPGFLDTVDRTLRGDVEALVVGRRVRTGGEVTTAHAAALGDHTGPEAARGAMTDRITPFPWDKAFRRTLIHDPGFPEGVARFEDLASVIVFLSRARRVEVIDTPLIEYRVSPGSLTWGRVPTREERDAALAHVRDSLAPELLRRSGDDLAALRVLLTVLIAQSASLQGAQEHAAVLRSCRADLGLGDVRRCLVRNPVAGAAALALTVSPRAFGALVRLRTRHRYRQGDQD